MPELFEIVALNEDGIDKAPHPTVPYYIKAREGNFLYRDTQIGTVLLPEKKMPDLGRVGYAQGVFSWKGEKIPGRIISQAQDFFKRIYMKHHAEAEVLITMHNETGEFRLFIPYQRVSHAGVKSIYEPTHVNKNYTVVGTLHSHCDFSAFHSGTDSGDASDMDGVHFTIGHNMRDVPEIVAMVAMNGKEFHYKDPAEIADIEYGTETAPAWWDQYILLSAPKQKPKGLTSLTQAHWDEFLGLALVKPKVVGFQSPNTGRPTGWVSPYQQPTKGATPMPPWMPQEKKDKPDNVRQFSRSRMLQDDWGEDGDWRKWVYGGYSRPTNESMSFNRAKLSDIKTGIPELDTINEALDLAEASGIFNDSDWNMVAASDMDEIVFWQKFFANKIEAAAEALAVLGMDINYNIMPKGAEA
jgi:Prokaryotic homologs of the JAB domain